MAAAVTVELRKNAAPGDRFRLDVLQRRGERVMGGSTYSIVVPILGARQS